ncbi:Asparaginase, partial [human gut metagenome]
MNKIKGITVMAAFALCIGYAHAESQTPIRLVIHGGAGTITKDTITPEQEKQY